jgi:polysaccharide deacetylase family protein (PEP-CTERM system associated)
MMDTVAMSNGVPKDQDTPVLNAFTVDVEDYFQVSGFENQISRSSWCGYESRVVANTEKILKLLARHQVQATFFVLGWVAERFPTLVRRIQSAGHSVGSHSFWHHLVYRQTPAEFRADLRQSKHALEDSLGEPVRTYRAPSFSITRQSMWALEILADEGFEFDSSIFPIVHDRYGIPGARPDIHPIATQAGTLWEFPPSVTPIAGFKIPVSGGGYFRLYPSRVSFWLLRRINQCLGRPFVFYVHPWELDPDQPRLRAGSSTGRFRHYVNLARTERKLEALLRRFRFGTLQQSIVAARADKPSQAPQQSRLLACSK